MEFFLENSTPIWVAGGILLTMAAIVYSSLRTTWSLVAVVVVVLLTAAGLVAEQLIQTPREQVQATLQVMFEAIEADDVPGVLSHLATSASEMRSDAQTLMPEFEIEKARLPGAVEVLIKSDAAATVTAKVFVQVTHKKTGMRGGNFAEVDFDFIREGDRWLVESYSVSEDWRRGAAQLRKGR